MDSHRCFARRNFAVLAVLVLATALGVGTSGCGFLWQTTVTSVEPSTGPTTGGTSITIIGANLIEPLAITLNDVAVTDVKLINARAITAKTPPGEVGSAVLALRFADGRDILVPDAFTYEIPYDQAALDIPPTIAAITPTSGPAAGGTPLTVRGNNFAADGVLLIGDKPAAELAFLSDRLITATTPPGDVGQVPVTLITADGRSTTFPPGFTYLDSDSASLPQPTIKTVNPLRGPTAGGAIVTITGSNFAPGMVTLFGDTLAMQTTYVGANVLTAVTPPRPAGLVAVTLVLPDGRRVTMDPGFTFDPPPIPTIATFSPTSGSIDGGTPVTIRGTGFAIGTLVFFGDALASSVQIASDQALTAVTPPHPE